MLGSRFLHFEMQAKQHIESFPVLKILLAPTITMQFRDVRKQAQKEIEIAYVQQPSRAGETDSVSSSARSNQND